MFIESRKLFRPCRFILYRGVGIASFFNPSLQPVVKLLICWQHFYLCIVNLGKMQGDWWPHGHSEKQIERRYSTFSSSSSTWATPTSTSTATHSTKATTPKIVTLTVQPLTEKALTLAHCSAHSRNHAVTSSTESILAQARRRRRLNMKQKTFCHGKRKSLSI